MSTLLIWGRMLLVGGLVALGLSLAPIVLIGLVAPNLEGFVAALAVLLSLSVAPLAAVVASVGAILLLVWAVRRDRP